MSTAARVVAVARSQLGIHESPSGSNRQKFGAWYGMNGQPWCAMFVSFVFRYAGQSLPHISTSKGFAYTPAGVSYAKAHGLWSASGHYRPGDVVFYTWSGRRAEHTGIITSDNGRTLYAIEGNTGAYGGSVTYKARSHGSHVMGVLQMSRLLH